TLVHGCRHCRGAAPCYFQFAAGPPAVFSKKGRSSSSSKMRTGESCLVVVGFSFEFVRAFRPRTQACVLWRRTFNDHDARQPRPHFNASTKPERVHSPHEEWAMNRGVS